MGMDESVIGLMYAYKNKTDQIVIFMTIVLLESYSNHGRRRREKA